MRRLAFAIGLGLGLVRVGSAAPRCVVPPPPAVAAPGRTAPPCHRASAAIEKSIRDGIANDYDPERDGGHGEVAFACDGLAAQIADIVVEIGSGHGGTLSLCHAQRRADGSYDLRGIAYRGASIGARAADPPYQLAGGTIALPQLDVARAALTASVHEVDPPPPPNGALGAHGSFSSNDFHLLVRLVDDDGRVVERQFTGYGGTGDQDSYLLLERAATALAPMTSLTTTRTAVTAADRELFAARFVAAAPKFDDAFYWWVMESYVALARFLGTPPVLPGLLSRLTFAKADRSHVDARKGALAAIAAITGWDARTPGESDDAVAATYLVGCAPAAP